MQDRGIEEMYRIVAENTRDTIVVVDGEAVVRYVSPSIYEISGYSVEQYTGMDAFSIIHPEDQDRVRAKLAEVVRTKRPLDVDYRLLHREGNLVYLETRVKPVLDEEDRVRYVVAVVRDVTSRKMTERLLEESEQRYKSLFDHNLDAVFSIELEGLLLVNANSAFERMTGIRSEVMKDRCFIGLLHDEDHTDVFQTLHEVKEQGEPRDLECRLASGDEEERIVSITFVPIFLSGSLNGIHGILKDITRRKQEERTLVRSEERSKFLQMSLNRLSNGLANVMKVSELEEKLLGEIGRVLPGASAAIEEQEDGGYLPGEIRVRVGDRPQPVWLRLAPGGELEKNEAEWLDTAVQYARILYDNLHRTEDLMKRLEALVATNETPRWMLRLLFKLSEKERAALSSDLHDTVLQDLIIWYRKLESLRSAGAFQGMQEEMVQIENGILDAIHQLRITCNELRPPFLVKMGLIESLKSLFSYARMFANYEIEFHADRLDAALNEDQIVGVYRIVQELLNNASKHSRAERVTMTIEDDGDLVRFQYADDGVGVDRERLASSFQHMGIAGIEKRALSLDGDVEVRTAPNEGFRVTVTFPKLTT